MGAPGEHPAFVFLGTLLDSTSPARATAFRGASRGWVPARGGAQTATPGRRRADRARCRSPRCTDSRSAARKRSASRRRTRRRAPAWTRARGSAPPIECACPPPPPPRDASAATPREPEPVEREREAPPPGRARDDSATISPYRQVFPRRPHCGAGRSRAPLDVATPSPPSPRVSPLTPPSPFPPSRAPSRSRLSTSTITVLPRPRALWTKLRCVMRYWMRMQQARKGTCRTKIREPITNATRAIIETRYRHIVYEGEHPTAAELLVSLEDARSPSASGRGSPAPPGSGRSALGAAPGSRADADVRFPAAAGGPLPPAATALPGSPGSTTTPPRVVHRDAVRPRARARRSRVEQAHGRSSSWSTRADRPSPTCLLPGEGGATARTAPRWMTRTRVASGWRSGQDLPHVQRPGASDRAREFLHPDAHHGVHDEFHPGHEARARGPPRAVHHRGGVHHRLHDRVRRQARHRATALGVRAAADEPHRYRRHRALLHRADHRRRVGREQRERPPDCSASSPSACSAC